MTRPPTARLRRLGAELRRLRGQAGYTQEQVAQATGVSVAALRRVEHAESKPRRTALKALLDHYQVEEPLRSELLELHRSADQQGWLATYADVLPGEYAAYIQFEDEAEFCRNFAVSFVPGLLQTPEYARAVIAANEPGLAHDAVARRVEARMARQQVLRDGRLALHAVIDEAVLRRQVGGSAVMHDQVARLVDDADLPNVTLQVIPNSYGAHACMAGPFVILEFAHKPRLAYLEGPLSQVILDGEDETRACAKIFEHLCQEALTPDQSIRFLSSL